MIIIADSGSTKTDWLLGDQAIETVGLNPIRDSEEQIKQVIRNLPQLPASEIYFYGAGCISPYSYTIVSALACRFPDALICVESDMLGAARATCGNEPGIVAILGTGSNSCLYDGKQMVENVSPLGFILGDEGSGAVLGRTLVGDALKGQLGDELRACFLQYFNLTPQDIIDKVYRQPMPNRFLASLVPFLRDYRHEPLIHELIVKQFKSFIRRNILLYNSDLDVHFVGGVAATFQSELLEAAEGENIKIGSILLRPIDGLRRFHARK